jgi:hypothetical protein
MSTIPAGEPLAPLSRADGQQRAGQETKADERVDHFAARRPAKSAADLRREHEAKVAAGVCTPSLISDTPA